MNYIFITGMGRSGTNFLAYALRGLPGTRVEHEYFGNREFSLLSWYLSDTGYSEHMLRREKTCLPDTNQKWFIDVNSYLRNSVDGLHEVFNPEAVFHLVRHPKHVVRSLYIRRDDERTHIVPKESSTMCQWLDSDKFFQVCWNWADTTRRLLENKTKLIRFESLVSDYEYFHSHLLTPHGFSMIKTDWEHLRSQRRNRTRSRAFRRFYARFKGKKFVEDTLAEYDAWTSKQRKVFQETCGPLLSELGYDS